jgi:hypothetical protein
MNKERFEELADAIRRAKAVRRGEAAPARVWEVTRGKDGKVHRRQLDPEQYRRSKRPNGKTPSPPRAPNCGCRKTSLRNCSAFPSRRCTTGNKAGANPPARRACFCAWPHGILKWFWKKRRLEFFQFVTRDIEKNRVHSFNFN